MPIANLAVVPLVVPFVAGAITLTLAAVAWRRRKAPAAIAFSILLVLMSGRLIAMGGGAWANTLEAKLDWRRLEVSAAVFILPILLLAIFQLVRLPHHITRVRVLLALIVPAGVVIIHWIGGANVGFLSGAELRTTSIGTTVLVPSGGHPFYIFLIYSALMVAAALMLLGARASALRRDRTPLLIFMGAVASAVVANLVDIFWLTPSGSPINAVPFSYLLTAVAVAVAFDRYGLLEIMPIARAALADQLKDCVVVLSASGEILELNPAAVQMFGASRNEYVGQLFTEVAPREIAEGAAILREGHVLHTKIDENHFEIKNVLLLDSSQESVGKIVIVRDLTTQRRAEIGQQKVFSTLSHEVRSAVSLLIRYGDYTSGFHSVEVNQDQLARILRLVALGVDRLVDMSIALSDWIELIDSEHGTVKLNFQHVTVASLIDSAIEEITPRAQRRSQTVDVNLEDAKTVLLVDARRLHRALTTAFDRAINRCRENGKIGVRGCLAEGSYKITVTDDGRPVSSEQLRFMFDPFAVGAGGTTPVPEVVEVERYRLATAKGFIELLGGEIYHTLPDEPESGLVLELPVAFRLLPEFLAAPRQ